VRLPNETRSVTEARHAVEEELVRLDMGPLRPAAALVVTELVSNAVLYTEGPVEVELQPMADGIRLSVSDCSETVPVVPTASEGSMTGRSLLLVQKLAAEIGFERTFGGKTVWAELVIPASPGGRRSGEDSWPSAEIVDDPGAAGRYRIELGDVPTDLLLAAKAHVDNLVREFALAAAGAESGTTSAVPVHLASLIETVVNRFSEARSSIKRQALEAARKGLRHTRLRLDLASDAGPAAREYLRALDEVDAYCRAARLLTLETPPKHRVFRRWYIGEIVEQLQRAQRGLAPEQGRSFEQCLLEEIDKVAAAESAADRAARLYRVAAALSSASTPEQVADAVLTEGAGALGASGGGLLLRTGSAQLTVPGTVGYDARVVDLLRAESVSADLPAATAVRTGQPVWLESRDERDARFPGLAGMERGTSSLCAVPLEIGGAVLGALRFSFSKSRLFDEDERRFVLALAAQTAQALDRAQLYRDREELSRWLQSSLLPPALPEIPGVALAAAYHPLGDGLEVGGDFYHVWMGEGRQWFFALGDVSGTGPEAAGMTALVRHSLRAITRLQPDIQAALSQLNDILIDSADGLSERFCTAIVGTIVADGEQVRIRMATGGHPGPVLRRSGETPAPIPLNGTLLGQLASIDVATEEVVLRRGDSLIFYTDGVTEARNGQGTFETEGLLQRLERAPVDAQQVAAALEAEVLAHSGGVLHDDMALLVIQSG
jgi:serine phosphatase RsbU (regulator of sigma subunit)